MKWKDFGQVEIELAAYVGKRVRVIGDGPKAIFTDAVRWLRGRDVLLPGVSRLDRLVARDREETAVWDTLPAVLSEQQVRELDALLMVPPEKTDLGAGEGGSLRGESVPDPWRSGGPYGCPGLSWHAKVADSDSDAEGMPSWNPTGGRS
ncbi:DUF4158 domain-containing protein [Nonomuraea jabiensis]|uniref:DUF4158 domain-containing protein n=1 Tax=Nonomuraea jabiensis TaxID=882448 RepID=UPI003D70B2F4